MALHPKVKDELKELRKAKRALVKREKELKAEDTLEKSIGKWQTIMDVKDACQQVINKADLGISMNLQKLSKFPTFYIYQHPIKKSLKTSNRQAEWVKIYLGEIKTEAGGMGGVLEDLTTTARKSTLATWAKANKKKKRIPKPGHKFGVAGEILTDAGNKSKGGKASAVGKVGVG